MGMGLIIHSWLTISHHQFERKKKQLEKKSCKRKNGHTNGDKCGWQWCSIHNVISTSRKKLLTSWKTENIFRNCECNFGQVKFLPSHEQLSCIILSFDLLSKNNFWLFSDGCKKVCPFSCIKSDFQFVCFVFVLKNQTVVLCCLHQRFCSTTNRSGTWAVYLPHSP